MKQLILFFVSILPLSFFSQTFMQGFEGTTLPPNWDTLNLSGPTKGTVRAWFASNQFTSPPPAIEGAKFYAANYKAEGNNGTISSWMFTHSVLLTDGDVISFYTRVLGAGTYPDRLEFRMSTNGMSTNVGSTPTSVGDFSTVIGVINPSLTTTGYPLTWTKFTYTVSGVGTVGVAGKFAFRYFVTNGGPNGVNSDAIGLDSVYYKWNNTTGIIANLEKPFRIFPNPSNGLVKINFADASEKEISVINVLGEIIENRAFSETENDLDLSSFPKGLYFLTVKQNEKSYTEKLILD